MQRLNLLTKSWSLDGRMPHLRSPDSCKEVPTALTYEKKKIKIKNSPMAMRESSGSFRAAALGDFRAIKTAVPGQSRVPGEFGGK